MKSVVAILIGIGFIAIALFGFVLISSGHTAGHADCLSNFLKTDACAAMTNPFNSASLHLNILKYFSTAVIPSIVLAALMLFAIFSLVNSGIYSQAFLGRFAFLRVQSVAPGSRREQFLSWLANFEKRDPALSF